MPKIYRTSQSAEVADLIRSGFSVTEALRRTLTMSDGTTSAPTSDVLADLQDMGVWSPTPLRKGVTPVYRDDKLMGHVWKDGSSWVGTYWMYGMRYVRAATKHQTIETLLGAAAFSLVDTARRQVI
jgi:hypothetical protein